MYSVDLNAHCILSTTILGRLTPWLMFIAPSRTVKKTEFTKSHQLSACTTCQKSSDYSKYSFKVCMSHIERGNFPTNDLKAEFQSVLGLSGQTFLIIDALDESPIGDKINCLQNFPRGIYLTSMFWSQVEGNQILTRRRPPWRNVHQYRSRPMKYRPIFKIISHLS